MPSAREPTPPPRPRDPYTDLLRETRPLPREVATAREAWLAGHRAPDAIQTLFELEMLVKALTVVGHPRHLPGRRMKTPLGDRDFKASLVAVYVALARVCTLAGTLATSPAHPVSRRLLGTLLPDDPARAAVAIDPPGTAAIERAIHRLRADLAGVYEVIGGVLLAPSVPLRRYRACIALIEQTLEAHPAFDVGVLLEFRAEFDRLTAPDLLAAIGAPPADGARRLVTLAYLAGYRALRVLVLAESALDLTDDPTANDRATLLLSLVRAETRALATYVRARAGSVLADALERDLLRVPAREMHARFDSLAGECAMLETLHTTLSSTTRVLDVEVRTALATVPAFGTDVDSVERRNTVRRMVAGVRTALQAMIVRVTASVRGDIDPARLFAGDAVVRADSVARLRRDTWMFLQVLRAFLARAKGASVAGERWDETANSSFARDFVGYFDLLGAPLVRATDHVHASELNTAVRLVADVDILTPRHLGPAVAECERFAQHLTDTFEQLGMRREMAAAEFDKRAAAEALVTFMRG